MQSPHVHSNLQNVWITQSDICYIIFSILSKKSKTVVLKVLCQLQILPLAHLFLFSFRCKLSFFSFPSSDLTDHYSRTQRYYPHTLSCNLDGASILNRNEQYEKGLFNMRATFSLKLNHYLSILPKIFSSYMHNFSSSDFFLGHFTIFFSKFTNPEA